MELDRQAQLKGARAAVVAANATPIVSSADTAPATTEPSHGYCKVVFACYEVG
jgi:hypothetical protein